MSDSRALLEGIWLSPCPHIHLGVTCKSKLTVLAPDYLVSFAVGVECESEFRGTGGRGNLLKGREEGSTEGEGAAVLSYRG